MNTETLRKVIREEVKHLATQESVDNLAMSVARGFESTADKEDLEKLTSKVDALVDGALRDVKKRVTALEAQVA